MVMCPCHGLTYVGHSGVPLTSIFVVIRTSSGVTVSLAQPRQDTLQVLPRQAVVGQHNVGASGVIVTKAQPRQVVVRQHNVRALV
jgi:hypothetical protein